MAAVKGLYADENGEYTVRGEPDMALARELLHGPTYHRAKAEIMVFGQVHGPYVRKVGNQTLVCGASAAVNWDGDNRPAYVILEYHGDGKWEAEIHRVEYDFEAQAVKNENGWDPGGDKQAKTIRTGYFWNPAHMPH